MNDCLSADETVVTADWLLNGGEMGQRIRRFDWSRTPLGPVETWPAALRTMTRILLANRFPMLLWWGPQYISIYNDPYRPVLGTKHPWALGQPVSECWKEIWPILKPLIDRPFHGGPATWNDDILLELNRNGFFEETHFTIAYSPVPDESAPNGIGGVLATVTEITEKVVGERRVTALRDLGVATEAKTAEEACARAAKILANHPKDIPFACLYLVDPDGKVARLAGSAGIEKENAANPLVVDLTEASLDESAWPLAAAVQSKTLQKVPDLASRLKEALPPGPWSDPPREAVVVPIRSNIAHQIAGLLVVGVSARVKLDHLYRSFFELVAGQIATAITNARAYEEERKRAEALAELDRAKTAFFNNVSHEFRTPLTLMLGPLEDLLKQPPAEGAGEQLALIHRNSLRLLKLVNTLLDFSRIEAGRVDASYEPTDLAAYTAELASVFRSAIEKAGLRLVIDCPPLPELVYVDRQMWEKIVLNLLSNAFKFTFEGEIAVSLRWLGERVELTVRDTGIGIAEDQLGRVFERFHRIPSTRARTHEGTGIGLALVQELARLHGGEAVVQSTLGRGSSFTVTIQTGTAHLPPERIGAARGLASTSTGASPFLEEALRGLPEQNVAGAYVRPELATIARVPGTESGRIVLADDNADMRDYVRRLLAERGYEIIVVADGQAALEAVQKHEPDLVLTDVMMPRLDGFGLLRALRNGPQTSTLPVILLSARAGEESRVEGLDHGADDYLIKPFSARELLARVRAHLEMARVRQRAEAALRRSREHLEELVSERTARLQETIGDLETFSYSISHDMRAPLRAMQGFARMLEEESGATLSEDSRGYLRRIMKAAERMDRLILDVLSYSRVAREFELRPASVGELLTEIIHSYPMLQPPAANIHIEGPMPTVMGNVAALTQCFSNFLGNAVKFVRPGVTPSLRIWAERLPDSRVRIYFRDNGIGISNEFHARIFGMFQKLSTAYEGTGIGLAIVKKAAERMGGTVGVESESDRGSTFWIELQMPA